MSHLDYWIWLSLRLGPKSARAALEAVPSVEEVYHTGGEALGHALREDQRRKLQDKDLSRAREILEDCQRLGVCVLTLQDREYPRRLREIKDAPTVLYALGHIPDFDQSMTVALVGKRDCTPYGIACARRFGAGLGKGGAIVVSGLARGIDSAGLRSAIDAGGFAVGVVGNGVDVAYPASSAELYRDLGEQGLILSEYPPGTEPRRHHFPARNRIISGLSLAALVIEAGEHSGSLLTASLAERQGREVFAVPGPIDSPGSVGCNQLLRRGSGAATCAWDILEGYADRFPGKLSAQEAALGESAITGKAIPAPVQPPRPQRPASPGPRPPLLPPYRLATDGKDLPEEQIQVLRALKELELMSVDDLYDATELPVRKLLPALTMLSIKQLVKEHPGKHYTRMVTILD